MNITDEEQFLIRELGEMFSQFVGLPDNGRHPQDNQEFCAHVHALQRIVMARAVVRAYGPNFGRLEP